ncbi:MAG TPA: ATP-binding protein [Burkholderiaceae bacterium]
MARTTSAFVIALLGAESTGKTTLAAELQAALAAPGRSVGRVAEYLREFCELHGRTPRRDEQRGIALEQTRRIAEAAAQHDIVIADTTALMIAVYSDYVFDDTGLYADALAAQARCDLTLLTALDLPWAADGWIRDGAHAREPVDTKVRAALDAARVPYAIVAGQGLARRDAALACIGRALAPPPATDADAASSSRWQWHCERCGDIACERHALRLPR